MDPVNVDKRCPVAILKTRIATSIHKKKYPTHSANNHEHFGRGTSGTPCPNKLKMEDRILNDDSFVMSETLNLNFDLTSESWNSLDLSPSYYTNDASLADVQQGIDPNTINADSFDTLTYPIGTTLYNTNDLPDPDIAYSDSLNIDWDFMIMSVLATDPSTTTLTASVNSTEPSDYSSTYITSPTSFTQSPTWILPVQTPNVLLERGVAVQSANTKKTRKRRSKMKPGTRPCDMKREKRKKEKPERCHICEKGHQWKRDLDRHYITNHPEEAEKRGLHIFRPRCKHCGRTFARGDHLTRHVKRKHGG